MEEKYTIDELIDFMYNVMDWQDSEDEPAIYAIIDILKLHKKTEKEITSDLLNEYVDAKHKVNHIEERLFNKAIEVLKWESENLGKKSRYINGNWICKSVSIENAVVCFSVYETWAYGGYDEGEFSIELYKLLHDGWRDESLVDYKKVLEEKRKEEELKEKEKALKKEAKEREEYERLKAKFEKGN